MSHGKIVLIGIAAVVCIFVAFGVWNRSQPGTYDSFAQCLKDKGAIFYGAFWCPHCQEQKAMFGRSERLLPYVECSLPNRTQTAECNEAGVKGYPTWVFPNDERVEGTQSFETLAEQTGCELPT